MKVNIGPYINWIGPYQIADKVFFWCKKYPELQENGSRLKNRWDYRTKEWLGEFLAHGFQKRDKTNYSLKDTRTNTWFYNLLEYIHSKRKRTFVIKTHPWDHWNLDATLSPIILPLLKDLKRNKHGAGYIELEDVPPYLRYTETEDYDQQYCFEFYHDPGIQKLEKCDIFARYDWMLNELIWTFEQLQPDYDWEAQYSSGTIDFQSVPCEWDANGDPLLYQMVRGPNDTYKCDYKALHAHQLRINNGLRLFGKYYQNLWD